MKTKNNFLLGLLALSLVTFSACVDGDTTKPLIDLHEPADGDVLLIGDEHGIHFEADFSDNEALAAYRINIHSNFDGHEHVRDSGPGTAFAYDQSWSLSGKNAHVHHHHIQVPEDAQAGNYHLMVYCTDVAGNESYIAVHIVLSHDAESGDDHDHGH
jgi:hypothetical protein